MKLVTNEKLKALSKYDLVINLSDKKIKNKNVYNYTNNTDLCKFLLHNDFKEITLLVNEDDTLSETKYLISFLEFYKKHFNNLKNNQHKINEKLIKENGNDFVKKVITDFCDLNQDGKYIRGVLIALGEYLATDNKKLTYMDLAYAYEIFQTSILVHDDIIDNANLRRGKKTIQKRIYDEYKNVFSKNDKVNLGNSIGICAGDYGFFTANNIIVKNYSTNKNFAKLLTTYNNIILNTIRGEIIDVYLPVVGKYNIYTSKEKDVLDIYHLKTSWYTIIGPFTLGYLLGGKELTKQLENVLNKIGIAFQLKDDILGIFANEDVIGKSNVSDIEEFKQTLLYSHIISTKYKNKFLRIYGKKKVNKRDLMRIRKLLITSGTYDYVTNYLSNLYIEVIKNIDRLDVSENGKDILKGLLIYIKIREK